MKRSLVVIVPGLFNEGVKPNDSCTWPDWVKLLMAAIDESVPAVDYLVDNYTDATLPEKILQRKQELGSTYVFWIGHSDGAADIVWVQDHMRRFHESGATDILFALDDVNDFLRHGFLAALDPVIVRRAIRIFQRADKLISSNPLKFRDGVKQVEEYFIGNPPFNHPLDNHEDVAEDPAVHVFISQQMLQTIQE